jgi:glutamate synthase domain-containing protein 2
LRTADDFVKAMALGADAIAVSNSAMQAIGCLAMRACHTNNCPVGIATQKPHLVSRLIIDSSALRLKTFFEASTDLMKVLARACGHATLSDFTLSDLTTFDRQIADLSGINYAGVGA